jgi:fibronectin type 3 domain-containing protein
MDNNESLYRRYTDEKGTFYFEIPVNCKEVTVSAQTIPTASGEGTLMSYITENNEKAFMLGITELGIELENEQAIQVMEYARENVAKVSEVLDAGSLEIMDLPALSLRVARMENKVQTYMDILFCIRKGKQYQLEVITITEAALDEPDARHFFESFKFQD